MSGFDINFGFPPPSQPHPDQAVADIQTAIGNIAGAIKALRSDVDALKAKPDQAGEIAALSGRLDRIAAWAKGAASI